MFIIVSYILTMDLPELFDGAEEWYNLLFQFSVGYIINFMFYITQVYIPNTKRTSTVQASISKRISMLLGHMTDSLSHLAAIYVPDHKGQAYTEEELGGNNEKIKLFRQNIGIGCKKDNERSLGIFYGSRLAYQLHFKCRKRY